MLRNEIAPRRKYLLENYQTYRNDFPNCFHSKDIKIKQPAKDIEIWEFARQNNFTILRQDDDFEKLLLLKGAPPKVIILKTFNKYTKQIGELLISKKRNY